MKIKHVQPNLPTLTCHHCGYDMHDRQEHDRCPECSTPLVIRPDAYIKRWKLNYPIVSIVAAMLVMPFLGILSIILLVPAIFMYDSFKKTSKEYRIPVWATQKIQFCHKLMIACLIEFWALMIISALWPQALNWW